MKSMVRTAKSIAETAGTSRSYAWSGPSGLAAALLALGVASASAEDAEVLSLDIERQQAGSALMELAASSGVQILVSDEAAAEVEVEGLQGQYRFADALAALLADTRLSYHYASEDVVLVEARQDDELEEVETANKAELEEQEPPAELAAQRVTGSRMARGDPSARVYSLSAEDIAARGVSSLEELFRTLPWAYASLTSQSDLGGAGIAPDADEIIFELGLGTSAVNLRAMGSANTLVLVNGRRMAGAAGSEEDFVNLVNIPLSAIERIDIQLDGASAVYGADAIGGIVNFITKRNYTGFSATFREEFSATDADRRNMSLKGGYAWGTGSVTAIAQRNDSKPINNRKIWTSGDFRERFGPEYDARDPYHAQPGRVCEWDGGSTRHGAECDWNAPALSLPATHDGTGATEEDFTTTITPADYVFPQNGADATNASVFLQIEQYLTDSLRIHADAQISNAESYRKSIMQFTNYLVPASNAHNPFGRPVVVSYYPVHELENGLVSPAWTENEDKQRNFNAGLFWQFGNGHEFELGVTRSESTSVDKRVSPALWPPNRFDPGEEAFYAALASSDPNVAPNLFGNGTAQKSTFANLLVIAEGPNRGFSEVTSWDALLRGEVWEVRGGPISYVIGAELRETKIYSDSLRYAQGGSLERDSGQEDRIGVEKPARDSSAWFAEFAIPLVGERNARPGLRELVLSLQARRDTHKSLGARGGREYVFDPTLTSTWREYHPDDGWVERSSSGKWVFRGVAQLREITRSATSPRIGLYWKPVESLNVRAAWSQSFAPPVFGQLFNTENDDTLDPDLTPWYVDPHHPDGVTAPIRIPMVSNSFGPNLRNEHSDNYSLGLEWISEAMPGLVWSVDWSRIDFTDKIEQGGDVVLAHPEIAFGLADLVRRDENGYAIEIIDKPLNLAEKISETIDTTIEYTFSTSWGVFTPRLSYHRVLKEFYRITPDTDRQQRVGTAWGSDRYKLTGHLTWTAGQFATDLYLRYTPGYTNNRTGECFTVVGRCTQWYAQRPPLEMDSLTTVDLTVAYRMDNGLHIRAGGRNILNADNPTVWEILPYDPTRWDARARVLYLELNWEI